MPSRNQGRGKGGKPVLGFRQDLDSKSVQASLEGSCHLGVAVDAVLQALFGHHTESLPQSVYHGYGGGVVIDPLFGPVVVQLSQAEVEARHFGSPVVDGLQGPGAYANGSKSGRRAKAFLTAAVTHIDAPIIHAHVMAAKGGDGVHDNQGIVAVDQVDDVGKQRQDACRGLAGDQTHSLDLGMFLKFLFQGLDVYGAAPRAVNSVNVGSAAPSDFGEAVAKETVAANNRSISRLQDVDASGLHCAGARGGHGKGGGVPSMVDLPEHATYFVGNLKEGRVEETDYRLGHGAKDPGVDGTGAGPQKSPLGHVQPI